MTFAITYSHTSKRNVVPSAWSATTSDVKNTNNGSACNVAARTIAPRIAPGSTSRHESSAFGSRWYADRRNRKSANPEVRTVSPTATHWFPTTSVA